MSYEKDRLDSFVTSASLSTALAPYVTSASVAAAIGAIDLSAYVSSNSLSAAVATDVLTVRGAASVSATLSAGAVTVAGRPVGAVVLGYQAVNNITTVAFSGSWSDFCMLEMTVLYRMSGTATASVHMFTDGGGTPILTLQTAAGLAGVPGSTPVEFTGRFLGINGIAQKHMRGVWYPVGASALSDFSGTANSGFVNCVRMLQSKTMSQGMAILIGYRTA